MSPALHIITGMPRAGSTLLANLLNQRTGEVWASSTSVLPDVLGAMSTVYTGNAEMTADLTNIPQAAGRNRAAMAAVAHTWYAHRPEPIIFDKHRSWTIRLAMLRRVIEPEPHAIVLVRHPCEVLASAELQHRASAEYQTAEPPGLWARCGALIAPNDNMADGLVGSSILGVEDMIRRRHDNVLFLPYTRLVTDPHGVLADIAKRCGLDPDFDHDVADVANTSTDMDALYRGKWPHEGSGPVEPSATVWQDVISPDIAAEVLKRCPLLCETFGYTAR